MLIRIIDLETSGMEPTADILEIAFQDIIHIPDRSDASPLLGICGQTLVKPNNPIPPESSAVHHLTGKDFEGAPEWDAVIASYFRSLPKPAYYAAHKSNFERQWITDDVTGGVPWICTLKCAQTLWPDAPGHSNSTLRYWLDLDAKGLDNSRANPVHRALPDAYVTAAILKELLKIASPEELALISVNPVLLPRIPFGLHRGRRWDELPTAYLEWMCGKDGWHEDVLYSAAWELRRRRDAN